METFLLFIAVLLGGALLVNLWPMRKFAPWVPLLKGDIEFLFQNISFSSGSSFVDLGCGDGRVVFAAAERFPVKAVGIELLYPLYWWCILKKLFLDLNLPLKIRGSKEGVMNPMEQHNSPHPSYLKRGVKGTTAFVWRDLFTYSIRDFDTVFVYGLPQAIAGKVKEKFERELKPGALAISPWFPIPGWEPERVLHSTGFQKTIFYVYRKQ